MYINNVEGNTSIETVGVVGCGAAALYFLKHIVDNETPNIDITFFSSSKRLGAGMPYDSNIVGTESLSNIAAEEIPDLEVSLDTWLLSLPDARLQEYKLDRAMIGPGLIATRAVLGDYFQAQFEALVAEAARQGVGIRYYLGVNVTDVASSGARQNKIVFQQQSGRMDQSLLFDHVVIATGHHWPADENARGRVLSSPWPIAKLEKSDAQRIGLIGSSLSAVDACLALARKNGNFHRDFDGRLRFIKNNPSSPFEVVMHSRRGMLPPLRCHFEFPRFEMYQYVSEKMIRSHIKENGNHLSLDYLFEAVLKRVIAEKSPDLYEIIKPMSFEDFAAFHLDRRVCSNPFDLLRSDYALSFSSIHNKKPIFWREALDDVTYTLNFYNRYLDRRDIARLRSHLMPLISHVVAVLPQQSCEQLLAMNDAGCLAYQAVGDDIQFDDDSTPAKVNLTCTDPRTLEPVRLSYDLIVDCRGQKPLAFEDFPFRSMIEDGIISPASIASKEGSASDQILSGINVDEKFHPISRDGEVQSSIFILASPLISGLYPYHSGLPFCDEISKIAAGEVATQRVRQLGASPDGTIWNPLAGKPPFSRHIPRHAR